MAALKHAVQQCLDLQKKTQSGGAARLDAGTCGGSSPAHKGRARNTQQAGGSALHGAAGEQRSQTSGCQVRVWCPSVSHLWRRRLWAGAALQQAILCHSHPPGARCAAPPHRRNAAPQLPGCALLPLPLLLQRRPGCSVLLAAARRMLRAVAGLAVVAACRRRRLDPCCISFAFLFGCASKPGAAPCQPLCISQPEGGRSRALPACSRIQPRSLRPCLPVPLLALLLSSRAGRRQPARQQLLLLQEGWVDGQARQQRATGGCGGGGQALQVRPRLFGVYKVTSHRRDALQGGEN